MDASRPLDWSHALLSKLLSRHANYPARAETHIRLENRQSSGNQSTNSAPTSCSPMMKETNTVSCLLCDASTAALFKQIGEQTYHRCDSCLLTFLNPDQMPSIEVERATYDMHENDPEDIHYRAFLRRATDPLIAKLKPGGYGLDYGCGPGPALAAMMSERGFAMEVYDPIYANDEDVLEENYDFITCTEVAEHFHSPKKELAQLDRMLVPGGWLAIMTSWLHDDIDFSTWHYRRDPTHVCFYQPKTFEYWARNAGWSALFPANNIVLLQKPFD